jgi:hypothetical protein
MSEPREGVPPIVESDVAEIHRVRMPGGGSLIVKAFRDPWPSEIRAYGLLAHLGVPTLRHRVQPPSLLLLEDLEHSPTWRLATPTDLDDAATGVALATWYRKLHAAGRELAASPEGFPSWLPCEATLVTHANVLRAARKLRLAETRGIRTALASLPTLAAAYARLAQTLTYNDFYWTNLALSRDEPLVAVVFDLHLLGRGPACADIRNVSGSLGSAARASFLGAMGPVDPRHAALDRPMAALHGLVVAAERRRLPAWAEPLLRGARDGTLEADMAAALRAAETLP